LDVNRTSDNNFIVDQVISRHGHAIKVLSKAATGSDRKKKREKETKRNSALYSLERSEYRIDKSANN